MPNKNYLKGRRREYHIKKKLEKLGWIVLRTAGSHGFADLIAINKKSNVVKFIQVKPKKLSEAASKRLLEPYEWLDDMFWCGFEVI